MRISVGMSNQQSDSRHKIQLQYRMECFEKKNINLKVDEKNHKHDEFDHSFGYLIGKLHDGHHGQYTHFDNFQYIIRFKCESECRS